jgi:1-acyl-sn-glycerol-3-phosphate acyltransferase
MLRLFWRLWWKFNGWKLKGNFPYHLKKMVLIVAPHTSWKDVIVGFAAREQLKIRKAKFLGKKELFDGPFGWLFRGLGGVPVDRFSSHGAVEQVVELFNKNDEFIVAMSPEGTRKKVDKLRTGFYHIAKQANVPIEMVAFDFSKKEVISAEPYYPTNDEDADFKHIIDFFAPIKGAKPELGLGHLKENLVKD